MIFRIVLEIFFSFLALLILLFLGGRLLGLRIAFLRGFFTAALGLGAGSALAIVGYHQGNGVGSVLSSAGLFVFPLLFTMAFMVLGELMAQPGSSLFEVLGWICLFVGAVLMMRVIAITARDQIPQRR